MFIVSLGLPYLNFSNKNKVQYLLKCQNTKISLFNKSNIENT